jgi:GAF domain-containing protein
LHQEHHVLSAHEFATLMLVRDSADHIAEREELGTLLEQQLVALERLAGGAVRPRITEDGESLLRHLASIH